MGVAIVGKAGCPGPEIADVVEHADLVNLIECVLGIDEEKSLVAYVFSLFPQLIDAMDGT